MMDLRAQQEMNWLRDGSGKTMVTWHGTQTKKTRWMKKSLNHRMWEEEEPNFTNADSPKRRHP